MLEEMSFISSIEIDSANRINVRRSDCILKNGATISETYHRHVIVPGDDVTGEDARVKAVAGALWTKEVIKAYKDATAGG